MKTPNLTLLAGALAVSSFASVASAQTTIYRETFGNNANFGVDIANYGWARLGSATAAGNVADFSAGANGTVTGNATKTNVDGAPQNLDNVNAGVSESMIYGFVFNQNTTNTLLYTNEYSFNLSQYELNSASWYSNRNTGSAAPNSQNVAIKIDGVWYVTQASNNFTTAGTAADFDTTATKTTFNLATASWHTLTATIGSPFSVSGTTTLPTTGTVEAFGIYVTLGSAVITRFDTFELQATAIPEPSAFAALAGLTGLGLAATRRRRR